MTLSPLVVLILLLFVMVVALVFLLWSLFSLRPTRATQTLTSARTNREKDNKTETFVKKSLEDKSKAEHKPQNHKEKARTEPSQGLGVAPPIPEPKTAPVEAKITKKHAPKPVHTPKPGKVTVQEVTTPVVPLVTAKQEALEPTLIKPSYDKLEPEPKRKPAQKFEIISSETAAKEKPKAKPKVPKFVVVETETSTKEPAKPSEQAQASGSSQSKKDGAAYDEDAFDRFIRSKNDDLNF